MLVDELYRELVGYIVTEDPDGSRHPIGTAFFVKVYLDPAEFPVSSWANYAVTARHVITAHPDIDLFIRFNAKNAAEYRDHPIRSSDWIIDPGTDLAVAAIRLPVRVEALALNSLATEEYARAVECGHDVFMAGLFEPFPGEKRIQPIVRFGKITIPFTQVDLQLDVGSNEVHRVDAHLIEAGPWGGESGSPVFVCGFRGMPISVPN
jgi:hypothetical protein